ncbi:MAG: hypothetical protein KF752_03300 [Pirellulaceae bacterium]|nr:hypothetical protein [Pirellulaceae bacterium]
MNRLHHDTRQTASALRLTWHATGLMFGLFIASWISCNVRLMAQYQTPQPAPLPPGYASSHDSTPAYTTLTLSTDSRSRDYSHSAIELGRLATVGYDDLARYRPYTELGGNYRQPCAIAALGESQALIPTKLTGELYLLNTDDLSLEVVLNAPQRQFTTIAVLGPNHCALGDTRNHQIVIFQRDQPQWREVSALATPGHPHSLVWLPQSQMLLVSGQWSQRLYRFQASDADFSQWSELPHSDLTFCGGAMAWIQEQQCLLVMDAFGGDYQVIDGSDLSVAWPTIHQAQLYEHNVAHVLMLEHERQLIYPMQLLNPETHSIQGEITWGNVLSNNLRVLDIEQTLEHKGTAIYERSRLLSLGEVGDGAGDPTSICLSAQGTLAVTLGGTDRVAIGQLTGGEWTRLAVGLRPVAALFTAKGDRLVVVNQFSDSLSIVQPATGQVRDLPLGPLREPTLAERGERLFFHSRLSHDGWMSCHSCHSHGHTNGQLNDNLSDGTLGTPKRIVSLLGQAETAPYGWQGNFATLEQQILSSLQSTMSSDYPISRDMVDALAAYVRSLPPPPGVSSARGDIHQTVQQFGQVLFEQLNCTTCHAGQRFTSSDSYDVDLTDERQATLFNPPSLIGVSQRTSGLLHDGRAESVEVLLNTYHHQLPRPLESAELQALIVYLQSL